VINSNLTPHSLLATKDTEVSYYKSLTLKTNEPISLNKIFQTIKTGKGFKEKILQLRAEVNKPKADSLKKQLPAITPSGVFENQRKIQYLIRHSGYICIDFDNVDKLENSKTLLMADQYSFAVFVSPSGKGLKTIVKIEAILETHKKNFEYLSEYYLTNYNLVTDNACKDVTRLMYLSYDENIYVNKDSKAWNHQEYQISKFILASKQMQEKNESFIEGNRNLFLYKLASICKRKQIPLELTTEQMLKQYTSGDFPEQEIRTTINSAYSSKGNEVMQSSTEDKNTHLLLARVEKYLNKTYEIRMNEVSTKIESRKKDSKDHFTELNENSLFRELQHHNLNLSLSKLTSLMQSDFVASYNPFIHYFEKLSAWLPNTDQDYIEKLASYIPVKNPERFHQQLKKMLVRSIACALDNRVFNKQVFVLVHDMQNSGKSTFLRWLCPPTLSNYIAENINTDKDSLIALATNFFINMDELATLQRAEINNLKSFISKDKINVRLPFGKRAVMLPRRANFLASTNKDEFLTDETGSVRWICFEMTNKIDFLYKQEINIDDVWRQAYTLYQQGFEYNLTIAEIEENEIANKTFQVHSAELDLIPQLFKPSSKEKGIFLNASEIHQKISEQNSQLSSKMTAITIGRAMKILGFKKESKYYAEAGYSTKGYYVEKMT
jgi:hypothetical protein